MTEYTFTEQEQNDLRDIFFSEAGEILQSLDQEVLHLETGRDRAGSLKNIQRSLHTLKGNSRAMGFTGLNTVAHKAEDLLKAIQDASAETGQEIIDILLAVNDQLQQCVEGCRSGKELPPDDRLLKQIDRCSQELEKEGVAESGNRVPIGVASNVYDIIVSLEEGCEKKSSTAHMILERLGTLGEVQSVEPGPESGKIDSAGIFAVHFCSSEQAAVIRDLIAVPGLVRDVQVRLHDAGGPLPATESPERPAVLESAARMLRVDAQRVDKILNLVGELVIGRSMVGQVLSEILECYKKDELVKRLGDANAFMEKTLSQLQKNVMKIRMLPISQVFRKFPRVVRDLAIEKGKQIELVMEGEKTELDKSILDTIGEPLIHLVRNAVDHGIEPPDERERTGKSRTGTVTLRATHEGNQIVIDIIDDGKGIDPAAIRKKTVEKGFKTEEEAARLTDDEALDLIFLSGFSTADIVTDISGRGLGMDIVRSTVESLKGRIQVRSTPGEGSVFTLRLPLTLAIIKAMLFKAGNRLFALPLSSIEMITRVREGDVQTVAGKLVLRHRDSVISLISLEEALMAMGGSSRKDRNRNRYVITVGFGNKRYGFLVDHLEGQQELVIKALENHWGTINCTSGASILGNGKVVLILDAPAIIMRERGREFAVA